MAERDHYTYRLSWSAEDNEHVATCAEFPSLSWLDKDEIEALRGVKKLVREAVEDLRASGSRCPSRWRTRSSAAGSWSASRRSSTASWPCAPRRRACP